MRKLNVLLIALLVVPLLSSGQGMTAQKVIEKVKTAYQEQMKGVNDMTKITNNSTSYQKWNRSGRNTVYMMRNEQEVNGKTEVSVYDGTYFYTKDPYSGKVNKTKKDLNPVVFYDYLDSWDFDYQGKESIAGRMCHVVEVRDADLSKMVDPTTGEPVVPADLESMENATVNGRMYVDASEWIMIQMDFDVNGLMMQGRERSASSTIKYEDIRNVQGVLVPYRTTTKTQISMSDKERKQAEEAEESMKEMNDQMKNMSEAEREMMKQHMKPQMEKMNQAMRYMSGDVNVVEEVQDVKINSGIPDKLFDGSRL